MNNVLKCKCCNRPFTLSAVIKKDLLCKSCRLYNLKLNKHDK